MPLLRSFPADGHVAPAASEGAAAGIRNAPSRNASRRRDGVAREPAPPPVGAPERLDYYLGFAGTTIGVAAGLTLFGYHLAGILPAPLLPCLLFINPVYFAVSLTAGARTVPAWCAVGLGFCLAPVLTVLIGREFEFSPRDWSAEPSPMVSTACRGVAVADLQAFAGDLWPYLLVVIVGFLPTEIWRLLGMSLASRLNENSEFFLWVRAVASALLAAVTAKLIFSAPGHWRPYPCSRGSRASSSASWAIFSWGALWSSASLLPNWRSCCRSGYSA